MTDKSALWEKCVSFWTSAWIARTVDLVLSFLLSLSDLFYLLIAGVEGYCWTWSHSVTHTKHTIGRTLLDWGSARRRDFYLTTHNIPRDTHSYPAAEFEPAIPASERPQNNASHSGGTGIGYPFYHGRINSFTITYTYLTTSESSLMSTGELCVTPLGAAASGIQYICTKKTRVLKPFWNQNFFAQITERFLSQCYTQEMNGWPTSATALSTIRTTLR